MTAPLLAYPTPGALNVVIDGQHHARPMTAAQQLAMAERWLQAGQAQLRAEAATHTDDVECA